MRAAATGKARSPYGLWHVHGTTRVDAKRKCHRESRSATRCSSSAWYDGTIPKLIVGRWSSDREETSTTIIKLAHWKIVSKKTSLPYGLSSTVWVMNFNMWFWFQFVGVASFSISNEKTVAHCVDNWFTRQNHWSLFAPTRHCSLWSTNLFQVFTKVFCWKFSNVL